MPNIYKTNGFIPTSSSSALNASLAMVIGVSGTVDLAETAADSGAEVLLLTFELDCLPLLPFEVEEAVVLTLF